MTLALELDPYQQERGLNLDVSIPVLLETALT